MQRLIGLILDSDANDKALRERVSVYEAAPRAYRRAVAALRSVSERDVENISVSLVKRKGAEVEGGVPATLIVASSRGAFSNKGWEVRVPVIEHGGELFVERTDGTGLLLTNSSNSDSIGYVYAYPMEMRALLAVLAHAIRRIAYKASMEAGNIEGLSRDKYGQLDKDGELELLTWWFKGKAETFHKESQQERDYVAFRSSSSDAGTGMIVRDIRERQFYPAPFSRDDISDNYYMREDEIEALAAMEHNEAMNLIYGIDTGVRFWKDDRIRMALTFDWEYAYSASAKRFAKTSSQEGAAYELSVVVNGEWVHPQFSNSVASINLELYVRFDAQKALCGNALLRGAQQEGADLVIDQPTAQALLRCFAIKRGIALACERNLVELDERNGYDVPLNEGEISYEEYLRMGLDYFFKLLDKAEPSEEEPRSFEELAVVEVPTVEPPVAEGLPAATAVTGDELADWERELLGGAVPVDPRREVASTIAKVSAHHSGRDTRGCRKVEDADALISLPTPSEFAFEEVLLWLGTYVKHGYPVIFKDEAARYITESMVVYLQRPEESTAVFSFHETKMGDEGCCALTQCVGNTAHKVMITQGLNFIAVSFDTGKLIMRECRCNFPGDEDKIAAFKAFTRDVAASKEPVFYFVACSDNRTRRSLVEGRELLATSLSPADILYFARNRGMVMPPMVVEKALPGQRGLLVRTNLPK